MSKQLGKMFFPWNLTIVARSRWNKYLRSTRYAGFSVEILENVRSLLWSRRLNIVREFTHGARWDSWRRPFFSAARTLGFSAWVDSFSQLLDYGQIQHIFVWPRCTEFAETELGANYPFVSAFAWTCIPISPFRTQFLFSLSPRSRFKRTQSPWLSFTEFVSMCYRVFSN